MKLTKEMKKALSLLLSAALVVTGANVTVNTTSAVKAPSAVSIKGEAATSSALAASEDPADDATTSAVAAETEEPADESAAPADESAAPADESAAPADESAAPADESAAPADESAAPADESAAPVDESAEPVDESAEPVDESAAPVDESAEPVDESAEPVDESAAPVDESAEPVEESAEPVDEEGVLFHVTEGATGWSDTADHLVSANGKTVWDGTNTTPVGVKEGTLEIEWYLSDGFDSDDQGGSTWYAATDLDSMTEDVELTFEKLEYKDDPDGEYQLVESVEGYPISHGDQDAESITGDKIAKKAGKTVQFAINNGWNQYMCYNFDEDGDKDTSEIEGATNVKLTVNVKDLKAENPEESADVDTSANPEESADVDTSANPEESADVDTSANPVESADVVTSADPNAPSGAPVGPTQPATGGTVTPTNPATGNTINTAAPTKPATGGTITTTGPAASAAAPTASALTANSNLKIAAKNKQIVLAPGASTSFKLTSKAASGASKASITAKGFSKKILKKVTVNASNKVTIKAAKNATKGGKTTVTFTVPVLKSGKVSNKNVKATVYIKNTAKKYKTSKKVNVKKGKTKTIVIKNKTKLQNKKGWVIDTVTVKGKILKLTKTAYTKKGIKITLKGLKKAKNKAVVIKVGSAKVKVKATVK